MEIESQVRNVGILLSAWCRFDFPDRAYVGKSGCNDCERSVRVHLHRFQSWSDRDEKTCI